jgi:hypothetical protein
MWQWKIRIHSFILNLNTRRNRLQGSIVTYNTKIHKTVAVLDDKKKLPLCCEFKLRSWWKDSTKKKLYVIPTRQHVINGRLPLTLSLGNRKKRIRVPRQTDYSTAPSPSRQPAQQTDHWHCGTDRSVSCYHIKFY